MAAQALSPAVARTSNRSMLAMGIGLAFTVGFYLVIPALPDRQGFLQRYFCSHPLEYVTTSLFCIALAILAFKFFGQVDEKRSLERDLVHPVSAPQVEGIEQQLTKLPARFLQTHIGRRWVDALNYVKSRRSPDGLDGHLRYLAELAGERLHESYSLIRTITWAIPILGFLGTVIGITIAIANVTPEQLDTSLSEVTGGLAVAFDTTALALALSIVLVFASFVAERAELQILMRVERIGIEQVAHAFGSSVATGSPLMDAQHSAGQQLLQQMESAVSQQTQLWSTQLDEMRARWADTMTVQSGELSAALAQGTDATLATHIEQLGTVRDEIVSGFQQSTEQFTGNLFHLAEQFATKIDHWQRAMQESTTAAAAQMEALHSNGQQLLQIAEKSEELSRLQTTLDRNLESTRAAEKFDEAVHNLSAAVHLLTARSRAA